MDNVDNIEELKDTQQGLEDMMSLGALDDVLKPWFEKAQDIKINEPIQLAIDNLIKTIQEQEIMQEFANLKTKLEKENPGLLDQVWELQKLQHEINMAFVTDFHAVPLEKAREDVVKSQELLEVIVANEDSKKYLEYTLYVGQLILITQEDLKEKIEKIIV